MSPAKIKWNEIKEILNEINIQNKLTFLVSYPGLQKQHAVNQDSSQLQKLRLHDPVNQGATSWSSNSKLCQCNKMV